MIQVKGTPNLQEIKAKVKFLSLAEVIVDSLGFEPGLVETQES